MHVETELENRCVLPALWLAPEQQTRAKSANKDEAAAMVKKAVSFIKEQGAEKAYAEISTKAGRFIDRDLYSSSTSSTARCSRTARTRSSSART